MATVACLMVASTGDELAQNSCAGCDAVFRKGHVMTAVEATDGEPLGWFCEACIQTWRRIPAGAEGAP